MICVVMGLHAQGKSKTVGWLSVHTVPKNAEVVVDGQFRGVTPLNRIELDSGKHVVKAVYPTRTSWNGSSKVESVAIDAAHETTVNWELEGIASLNSVPSGSLVSYQGRQIGVTPFMFKATEAFMGEFTLQKDGFKPMAIPVSGRDYFVRTARLDLVAPLEEWKFSDVLFPDSNGEPEGQWVNYAAGATMIVSGFLAAYYKDHANREFDNYNQTKDPDVLNSVRRLDKTSGISFTITQLSFAVLAYKLLLE